MHLSATLAHVALRHGDPLALAAFYEKSMGLVLHEEISTGVRLGWGTGDHALEIVEGRRGIDHVAFEVHEPGGLQELISRLDSAGVDADPDAPAGTHPPSTVVSDPDGNRVEFVERVDRSGEHVADPGRRPIRIQHVTLATASLERMVRFYTETVGFRVSDRMGDVFTWMRSDRAHHTLAVVAAPAPGLDHLSFDIGDWGDFKTWCDELADRGTEIAWGPGRHGPGNNLFVIFEDPAGYQVELSAEMERYWDDRAEIAPRVWAPVPKSVNVWGPTPAWRTV